MALTADERQRLDEIDRALSCTDRDLDRTLSTGRFRMRRMHAAGTCSVVMSLLCLVVGIAIDVGPVCLLGWALFANGMLLRSLAG